MEGVFRAEEKNYISWVSCRTHQLLGSVKRRKNPSEGQRVTETPVFSCILVPSALADPDHPLHTPLPKTPFRKHRLLLLGIFLENPNLLK